MRLLAHMLSYCFVKSGLAFRVTLNELFFTVGWCMMRGSRKCGGILHLLLQAGWLAESVKGRFIASFLYRPLTPYLILYNAAPLSQGLFVFDSLQCLIGMNAESDGLVWFIWLLPRKSDVVIIARAAVKLSVHLGLINHMGLRALLWIAHVADFEYSQKRLFYFF